MKKIAVIVRDRKDEALRMSAGLTLEDDSVDVFILDEKLERTEAIEMHLEMLKKFKLPIYTNVKEEEDFQYLSTRDMAKKLLEYDMIVPY
ncbi:MAG: hypothetical protein ACE5PM_07960 [Candidatus Hydrothermarchaeales archaeon]